MRELHPALLSLVEMLPPPGAVWPEPRRREWLGIAEHLLRFFYSSDEELAARFGVQKATALPMPDGGAGDGE